MSVVAEVLGWANGSRIDAGLCRRRAGGLGMGATAAAADAALARSSRQASWAALTHTWASSVYPLQHEPAWQQGQNTL